MPKFFRNIRIQSIKLGKVKNYLLYAVGEIILVVAGILIAVKVGDINEQKKIEEEFKTALKVVERDLKADIRQINFLLQTLKRKDSIAYRILEDEVTLQDLARDPDLFNNLMRSHFKVTIHFNGYKAITSMLENKPIGYDRMFELLSDLMDERALYITKFQNDVNDLGTNFSVFQRDNQNWDWMRQTKNTVVVEMEYEFYKKDTRLKNWVSFYLRKQHALMLALVNYREIAYESLIELQRVLEPHQPSLHSIAELINPTVVSLLDSDSKSIPLQTISISPSNLRDFGFSSTMLIKNEAVDSLTGYIGTSEYTFNPFEPIAPGMLRAMEIPANMNLYFFKSDSSIGFAQHNKYNQLITIK